MASYKVVLPLATYWKLLTIGHCLLMANIPWQLHIYIDFAKELIQCATVYYRINYLPTVLVGTYYNGSGVF